MVLLQIGGSSSYRSVTICSQRFSVKAYYDKAGDIRLDARARRIDWPIILKAILLAAIIIGLLCIFKIKNLALLAFGVLTVDFIIGRITPLAKNHGAEHKVITALENDLPLNLETLQKQSRFTKDCGTNVLPLLFTCILFCHFIVNPSIPTFHLWLYSASVAVAVALVILSRFYPWLSFQQFTTAEPTDRELNLAILAMQGIAKLEKIDLEEPTIS